MLLPSTPGLVHKVMVFEHFSREQAQGNIIVLNLSVLVWEPGLNYLEFI